VEDVPKGKQKEEIFFIVLKEYIEYILMQSA